MSGPVLGVLGGRLIGRRTGVGRYLTNLLREWSAGHAPFGRVVVATPRPVELPPGIENAVIPFHGPAGLWEHLSVPARLPPVDLLFCPSYIVPLGYQGRTALTVHDAIQAALPGEFPFWYRYRYGALYRWSARRAGLILADSHATAEDIVQFYRVGRERIRVVPLGVDPVFRPVDPAPVLQRLGLADRPYVLFVGKMTRRRNLPGLIEAFADADDGTRTLVLAGDNSAGHDLTGIAHRLRLGDRFRHLAFPPDDDLVALYSGADLFVYPSLREGFGLPIVEAMACGAPVLTVDASAMREVAPPGTAFLAQGVKAYEIAGPLRVALENPAHRQEVAAAGQAWSARFRWSDTARQTLDALADLVREGNPLGR
ncbi:MAG: glycosyltransferase family 1 protein [Dehalococcoidia bacterium]